MKKLLFACVCISLGIILFLWSSLTKKQDGENNLTIGTGGVTGVYYPTGNGLANIFNKNSKNHGFRLNVVSTGGSVFNVNALMMGDLEFGIIQSDRQYQAWKGTNEWKEKGPQKRLRAVCSLYPESVTLIAGDSTGIETLMDLKGKHVSIGKPGSGMRSNAIDIMESCGIDWRRDLRAEGITTVGSPKMLIARKIDAFFYTVGHPNDAIREATRSENRVHFVPLSSPCVDTLIKKWPYYTKATIPIEAYPDANNQKDIATFGVKATLCTTSDTPDALVYLVTKALFENLEVFKTMHPAYHGLDASNILEALSAPIHPGALKYYKEAGIQVPRSLSTE